MWVTKLLISPVKKRIFCPKTTKFGIFGQFGPGHAGLFSALLVGRLVVVARGLYLARHLFTLLLLLFGSQNQFIDSLHGHVQSKTSQFIGRMKITSYRMTSSYFSVFSLSNVYPFLAFLQLVYSLQDVIVDIGKKILPLWFCERSRLILSGCLVSASSHISSVHFALPFLMRHCGLG